MTGRTAQVCAYLYDDAGDITEYTLGSYGEMTVTDFDDDGVDELFTADKYVAPTEEGGEALPAKGRVYAYRDGAIQEIFSADADNSITSYSAVTFGRLYPELSGIVLDGVKADGSMTTQKMCIRDRSGSAARLKQGLSHTAVLRALAGENESYFTHFPAPFRTSSAPSNISRMISAAGCSLWIMPEIWPARKSPVFSSPSTAARYSAPPPSFSSSSSEIELYSALAYSLANW